MFFVGIYESLKMKNAGMSMEGAMDWICPICGCGELIESEIMGYECSNCGEILTLDDNFNLVPADSEEWCEQIERKYQQNNQV